MEILHSIDCFEISVVSCVCSQNVVVINITTAIEHQEREISIELTNHFYALHCEIEEKERQNSAVVTD